MIDREARDSLAQETRHLVVGLTTNDEYRDRRPWSSDPAVDEVHMHGVWQLYDDLHEHKLMGDYAVTKEGRREVARWILFLKSDLEYEWPNFSPLIDILIMLGSLFTLGLLGRLIFSLSSLDGDTSVWPFYRRADFEAALSRPPYFRGKSRFHQ